MVCVNAAMGISEERNHEIVEYVRDTVERHDTTSEVLESLIKCENLTDKERAYAIFVVGDAHGRQSTLRGLF